MPKLLLPFNLHLKLRGIKGVISVILITPLFPSYLKRGIFGKIDEIRVLKSQNRFVIGILNFI
jgi:hypothetical protein